MVYSVPKLKRYKFSKDTLENHDWYEKSWSGVLFPLYIVGYGCVYALNKKFSDAFRISITFVKQDKMSWLWDGRDMKRIRDRLLNLAVNRPEIIDRYIRKWRKEYALFKKIVTKLEKTNFTYLSDKDLYSKYAQLRDAYISVNSLPYLVDSFLTSGEDDWLARIIRQELENKVADEKMSDIVSQLTAPVKHSFSNKEEIDLLRIAAKLQRGGKVGNLLSRHAKRYYWTQNSYYPTEPLSEDYFLKKIKKILKYENIEQKLKEKENKVRENKKVKEKLYRALTISDKIKGIISTTEKFTAWQDTRKAVVLMTNHFVFQILKEIGRRVGLEPFEVFYITDHELSDMLFKKNFDKEVLRSRRQEGCVFIHTKRGAYIMEPDEAKNYPEGMFLNYKKETGNIKGVSACPGLVRGRVRVVESMSHFKDFRKGEILVTNNTTPDFVPLMRMAGAIITEQGGVTTHAAIISRELGIPCIIGTRVATRFFKDGDFVEVDAIKGVVKKIREK